MTSEAVIWHELECGSYHEDLRLWRQLADRHGAPVLDVGAGTGRVTLALARAGYAVTAVDRDPELLSELSLQSAGLPVTVIQADAREFGTGQRFPLCIVPMQTVQLLGGRSGRLAFFTCARDQLRPAGVLAVAIAEELDPFEVLDGGPGPLPDICERDGVVYASHPTAVRADGDGVLLERRREIVDPRGEHSTAVDRIRLDRVTSAELEREAISVGLQSIGRATVPATRDYVASEVVLLRA